MCGIRQKNNPDAMLIVFLKECDKCQVAKTDKSTN